MNEVWFKPTAMTHVGALEFEFTLSVTLGRSDPTFSRVFEAFRDRGLVEFASPPILSAIPRSQEGEP